MILGLHHVAIATVNIDRMLAFYRDVIGYEVVAEDAWEAGNARRDAFTQIKDSQRTIMCFGWPTPISNGALQLDLDAVIELWFDDAEAYAAFRAAGKSPEVRRLISEDEANFMRPDETRSFAVEEVS